MRKLALGAFAALAVVFLVASPAAAASTQEWEPTPTPPTTGIFIEEGVDEDIRNAVQTAFEAGLAGTTSPRYTYVAEVPETWNIETAARKTAEVWALDRNVNSILFYDAQGKKVFIWPATAENTAAIEALPTSVEAVDLANGFDSLYGEEVAASAADAEESETSQTIFMWLVIIFSSIIIGSVVVTIGSDLF